MGHKFTGLKIKEEDSKAILDWTLENPKFIASLPHQPDKMHAGYVKAIFDLDNKDVKNCLENNVWKFVGKKDFSKSTDTKYFKSSHEVEPASRPFPYINLSNINRDIMNHYGIPEDCKIANMGWILSYADESYLCTWHIDNSRDMNAYHTRFNVLLSKPKGGEPILQGREGYTAIGVDKYKPAYGKKFVIPVVENGVWVCVGEKYKHSTVKMEGKKPRILLSFGYNVPKVLLENLSYIK